MSGTTYYGVSLLEGQEQGEQKEFVFIDRVEALKVCKQFKGARFKCFTDREEALQFTQTRQVQGDADFHVKEFPSEKLPYPTPSPQEMLQFRKTIETGDCTQFLHLVWKNPRFLISAGDTPTMVRERYRYHGLLLASFKKEYGICKALLDTITDANFIALLYVNDTEHVRKNRMFYLLDTYLNTPDKFLNETPLHFSSKFGALDIMELFLSYPECDRERRNTKGETAADIICSSCKNATPQLEAQMQSLLSQRYFIPVLRPSDYSSPARVGKPWSPDVTPKSPESSIITSPLAQTKYPVDPHFTLQALAGPMSPKEAEIFYQKMKTPPVSKLYQSRLSDKKSTPKLVIESRLSDIDKGLERIGRNVAQDLKVPWIEYWSFLDEFCDLCSDDGLEKLEHFFREKRCEVDDSNESEAITQTKSPLSDLCTKLSQLHLQSPTMSGNSDDQFFTPPSTPPSHFYEITPIYIFGSQPSKTDVDVLRVLDKIDIDFIKYPNIAMWKDNMMQYEEEHLNKLKTPARVITSNRALKMPVPENQTSPRVSSITKCLNSPRKTRDLPVARLSKRFEEE